MNAHPTRRWFQFHLSTFLVTVCLLSVFLWLNIHPQLDQAALPYRGDGGLQNAILHRPWPWQTPRILEIPGYTMPTRMAKPIMRVPGDRLGSATLIWTRFGWPIHWATAVHSPHPHPKGMPVTHDSILAQWHPPGAFDGDSDHITIDYEYKKLAKNAAMALAAR